MQQASKDPGVKSFWQQNGIIYTLIALTAGAFVWLNLKTAMLVAPWIDEAAVVDAGVNLHLGKGWFSTAWGSQSQFEFWAANNPIYTLLIYWWVSIVGIAPVAVRSMNYLILLATCWIIADACRRSGILPSLWSRLFVAAIVACDEAVAYVYRDARDDLTTLCVVALLFWCFVSVSDPRRRRRLLFLCALPILSAGIQAIPYIFLLLCFDYLVERKLRIADIGAVVAGTATGGVALLSFLALKHALTAFMIQTFVSGFNIFGCTLQVIIFKDRVATNKLMGMIKALSPIRVVEKISTDRSLWPLILFLLVVAVFGYFQQKQWKLKRAAILGLIVALLIPYGMLAAGRYEFYYAWMGAVPLAIVFVVTLERCRGEHARFLMAGGVLAGLASILLGLPWELWTEIHTISPDAYRIEGQQLDREIRPGDTLFGDPIFYYFAKQQGLPIMMTTYSGGRGYRNMREAERASISILIMRPWDVEQSLKRVGGSWTTVDNLQSPYGFPLVVMRRAAHVQPPPGF
jgi:hypothetical protein